MNPSREKKKKKKKRNKVNYQFLWYSLLRQKSIPVLDSSASRCKKRWARFRPRSLQNQNRRAWEFPCWGQVKGSAVWCLGDKCLASGCRPASGKVGKCKALPPALAWLFSACWSSAKPGRQFRGRIREPSSGRPHLSVGTISLLSRL